MIIPSWIRGYWWCTLYHENDKPENFRNLVIAEYFWVYHLWVYSFQVYSFFVSLFFGLFIFVVSIGAGLIQCFGQLPGIAPARGTVTSRPTSWCAGAGAVPGSSGSWQRDDNSIFLFYYFWVTVFKFVIFWYTFFCTFSFRYSFPTYFLVYLFSGTG